MGGTAAVPMSDRPRERLYHDGVERLALHELLAVILGGGVNGSSARVVALRLIEHFGDAGALGRAGVDELMRVRGVGFARACSVAAAFELGRRYSRSRTHPGVAMRTPRDVARLFMDEMKHLDREHFRAALLNTKNRVIRTVTVSIGSLNASIVHPREILKPAIQASAASIVLVHNHPTGDPTPSREDIEFTRRFARCGELIGIDLLDHVIIGADRWQSLREGGYF